MLRAQTHAGAGLASRGHVKGNHPHRHRHRRRPLLPPSLSEARRLVFGMLDAVRPASRLALSPIKLVDLSRTCGRMTHGASQGRTPVHNSQGVKRGHRSAPGGSRRCKALRSGCSATPRYRNLLRRNTKQGRRTSTLPQPVATPGVAAGMGSKVRADGQAGVSSRHPTLMARSLPNG